MTGGNLSSDVISQMLFGVGSHPRAQIVNNVVGLAKAAKVFNVPTILTTVVRKSFSGPLFPELSEVFPGVEPIDRTSMNSWEDAAFVKEVRATGKKKLLIAALWTEVCLAFPALSALDEGYEVYAVTDASGGDSGPNQRDHHGSLWCLLPGNCLCQSHVRWSGREAVAWERRRSFSALYDVGVWVGAEGEFM